MVIETKRKPPRKIKKEFLWSGILVSLSSIPLFTSGLMFEVGFIEFHLSLFVFIIGVWLIIYSSYTPVSEEELNKNIAEGFIIRAKPNNEDLEK